MLLLAVIVISYLKTSVCVKSTSGQPVPHAEVLDEVLTKFLGDSYSNNALFDFILGEPNDRDANPTNDNLDIKILDVDNLRKIIHFAKNRYEEKAKEQHARRQNEDFRRRQAYDWNPKIVNKTMDLMLHTIYMTKERLNVTLPFRKKYAVHHSYQIAVLYGAGAAIVGKMESLLAQMKHFYWRTHFIWWLILYEKILACNIDVGNIVEQIFGIQKNFAKIRGPKPKPFKSEMERWKSRPKPPKDVLDQIMQQGI